MRTLAGTAALVTGGGSGIGLACAARLAADGAAVTICGRTEERLRRAAEKIDGDVTYAVADITDEEQIAAAVDAAAGRGPLRAVVANAGGSTSIGPIGMLDLDAWRSTLELNATGTLLTIRQAARVMAPIGGGAVVAISSIAASNTHRWFGAYGVSKAAVDHLVRLAADELGGAGIRVNGIRPGLVRTELVAGIADQGPVLEDYLACMPVSRIGEPEDVAEAARFLAGPESSWITGQLLNVDGGHHLRRGPDYSSLFEPMFGAAALRGLPAGE
ncbi:SDR family oxidoreductase [Thermomonospora cellulosilytica]|uniref:NAD(P)-dependent dehydrogenase (Short-subunit alcohol dehydrogenase family) n=1 Tax=Thermomonospora cellulosilytica TaxID=1411118 RepID=A0A7W3N0T2_9ACTN|nr:SDR family oxidoreductase [Thermomonospora cellulosilytica]MBA9005436.1 NAD(P)-dependent dehydrogenase (short-subunit alcohol dehydrogenase family) [Thermomonospora cellulosilytica]